MPVSLEVWRILDAAANRAGEGLRVVEEYARFALNDGHLSRLLKECRHDLSAALAVVPEANRLAARDTLGDVGTEIGTPSEYQRDSPLDVARASFKRVQEAVRTLEEYGKLIEGAGVLSRRLEAIRYRLYTAEKSVIRTVANVDRLRDQRLYLLVTSKLCSTGLEATVKGAMDAGVRMFQLREKEMADGELLDVARRLRGWTSSAGASLIINDRADIAMLCEADGVHVGQDELTVQDARRIVGADRLVGLSTHSIEQARQAVLDGADYLGVGPTFPGRTKVFDAYPGLDLVSQIANEISLPWFAIGGINEENLGSVLKAGARRIAVSNAVCAAPQPKRAAEAILLELQTG